MDNIVIAGTKRTPIGRFQGALSHLSAPQLGGLSIEGSLKHAGIDPHRIDEVYMGCVLPAGLGQAPARQAGMTGGIPKQTPATTINKMCGSGMKAIMTGVDQLNLNQAEIIVAGGMESMSRAPLYCPDARIGKRLGHTKMLDHMLIDGLTDAYGDHAHMGAFADDCATQYDITREDQDKYAHESYCRALKAQVSGQARKEIMPAISSNGQTIELDEEPVEPNLEKMGKLLPVFKKRGTVTPANSSKISDGAASVVLGKETVIRKSENPVLARIVGHDTFAQEPGNFPTSPIYTVRNLLEKLSWKKEEVDLWEVNEAFAVVALVFMKVLGIPLEKINVNGGACSLGHPIGCSGARIVTSLVHGMHSRNARRGIAAICIGGGEATSIALEISSP
ncbi:MAG: thiolase family protein [Rhodobacteraceae bacterium]|nr:thiolase family protein [Paracoccaceae bacterium]